MCKMLTYGIMPVLILIFMLTGVCGNSFLSWLWPTSGNEKEFKHNSDAPLIKIPFEALPDEKFLEEAKKYSLVKFSELDTCTQKVVMKIRSSCSDMSEEELGKTSVHLLNCQSAAEGRREYPCSDTMTLRQCTTPMDSDTWNAYLLVSNRARAVCYAARQQQFRALSEMTVNKLMTTAHHQLEAMNSLRDSQLEISSITDTTLEKVQLGHKLLLNQQEELQESQQSLRGFVARNLQELTREKALIAAGQREVSKLFTDMKDQFESTRMQLVDHALEERQNHDNILSLLNDYQDKLNLMWQKMESSTDELIERHMETAQQYDIVLAKLSKINDTVNFLHNITSETRKSMDNYFGWFTKFAGSTGDHLELLYDCILHACFLTTGMIALPFLEAPFVSRVCLIAVVVLNWLTYLYLGKENVLSFLYMALVVLVSTFFNWIVWAAHQLCSIRLIEGHAQDNDPQPALNGYASSRTERKFWSNKLSDICDLWSGAMAEIKKKIYGRDNHGVNQNSVTSSSHSGNRVTSSSHSGNRVSRVTTTITQNQHSDSESDGESVGTLSRFSRASLATSSQYYDRHDRLQGILRQRENNQSTSQTPLRAAAPNTPIEICEAICVSGLRCKLSAVAGANLCRRHLGFRSP